MMINRYLHLQIATARRLKHFVREFEVNLLYGFVFSLDAKLKVLDHASLGAGAEAGAEEAKLEEFILALADDIVQFKINSRASILS